MGYAILKATNSGTAQKNHILLLIIYFSVKDCSFKKNVWAGKRNVQVV